jgi:hypothetical protein
MYLVICDNALTAMQTDEEKLSALSKEYSRKLVELHDWYRTARSQLNVPKVPKEVARPNRVAIDRCREYYWNTLRDQLLPNHSGICMQLIF